MLGPLSRRRTRNGQSLPHIRGERRAKVLGIAGDGTPLVPLDDITVSQGFSPMHDAGDSQPVPIGPQDGRNNGYPLPGFGEGEQCVRGAALKQKIGLDVGNATGRIEQAANGVTGIQKQQRMGCKGNDINRAAATKLERRTASGEDIIGGQCEAHEPRIHALIVPDTEMNLAALQQGYLVHAKSLRQLYTHVGEAFGIPRQESGQDALDCLRRRSHLEHAGVSMFEQLYALAKRSHLTEHSAAIAEQLLASSGQEKPATDAVKKFESAFVFEIANLP